MPKVRHYGFDAVFALLAAAEVSPALGNAAIELAEDCRPLVRPRRHRQTCCQMRRTGRAPPKRHDCGGASGYAGRTVPVGRLSRLTRGASWGHEWQAGA